jgi:hypothetical protein
MPMDSCDCGELRDLLTRIVLYHPGPEFPEIYEAHRLLGLPNSHAQAVRDYESKHPEARKP